MEGKLPCLPGADGLLDDCVGRIIGVLKEKGLYDSSMIIFTSDHGEMMGAHCLFQKMCMYEESARVPFLVKLPESRNGGRHIEQPVSHIDVLPTICDYNSISPRHLMDGCSLRQLLEDGTDTGDRAVYIQYDGNASLGNYSRCVIDGNYKLIVDFFKDEIFLEVYDLDRDRLETDNLVFYEEYDEVAERLIGILAEHMREINDSLVLPAMDLKEFRERYQ